MNMMSYKLDRKTQSKLVVFAGLLLCVHTAYSQPIPVELMAGHHYASVNVVVSKNFTETSRLGFFHLNTITMDYDEKGNHDFTLQDLLFYEPIKNIRITGGAAYGKFGFRPTAGMQYVKTGKVLFILISPRINIDSEPTYNFFSIVRYKPSLTENTKLYFGIQLLNVFDANEHIKSYQWLRAGMEIKGIQFGLAAGLDEIGPQPDVQSNLGLFIRYEI
ncbi:MAG: hypothetical protein JW830_10835 [Bacteroidales bacterium]|nr:hypothetical protein [Bacteroidales bacterium]